MHDEGITEPRPGGSVTTSGAGSAFGEALPGGRGSVFVRSYTLSLWLLVTGCLACLYSYLNASTGAIRVALLAGYSVAMKLMKIAAAAIQIPSCQRALKGT
jgi:hypothetical protein